MKLFVKNILKFSITLLVCMCVVDVILSYVFRNDESRMFNGWTYIYNDATRHDVVINGGSRAWVQYNPNVLDSILIINSYNLGIDGSGINRQIIKYKKFVEKHGTPNLLIQNIDLFTLLSTYGYEREQFYPYFYYDRSLLHSVDMYEKYSFMERFLPGYRYIGLNQTILKNLQYIQLNKGYSGRTSMWDGTHLSEMEETKFVCDSAMLSEFIKFIGEVINQDTKIVFVYAPMYNEVRVKCTNYKDMYNTYQSIANKFDIPILDYNDIPMCYDTTYFYNATHLNRVGADLFSTKLAHDMDSLRLLK